ncbi:hypothetical protein JIN87_09980 [Pelagicoccus mobilis]|uniref:histidine kinase n=2 Tax=Pelagicoccus mobilis TaxID=415221 RepID=A0A934RVL0_9BACT|nr:hypothetical protein [Pelagicoccus mobilis]
MNKRITPRDRNLASHELFTPLNHIIGIAHILSFSRLDEDQRDLVARIIGAGDELTRGIHKHLD